MGGSFSAFGISDSTGSSTYPSLAINSSGNPVVAWVEVTSGNSEIFLKQWNGTSWEELGGSASGGGISNNSSPSRSPSLAITSSDNLIIAWHDGDLGDDEVYLKQWNGTSWEELGGSASDGGVHNSIGIAYSPSVAVNNSGYPVVAYSATAGDGIRKKARDTH